MSKLYVPVSELSSITLFVLGSQDNAKDSFVDVKFQDASKHNMPYPNGVYDLHMGTTDLEFPCSTCQHTKKYCPGHPGCITLKYPVQSPLYLKEIHKWAKVVCHSCGKMPLPDIAYQNLVDSRVRKENLLNEYVKLIKSGSNKNVICIHCNTVHPHIVKDKSDNISLFVEYYDTKVEPGAKPKLLNQKPIQLFTHEIEAIFNKISNETVIKLGKPIICHPRKFILRKIRAPPNTIRPDLKKLGSGRSNNNDVTVLLQYIIKVNEKFPDEIPKEIASGSDMSNDIQLLELNVYEMIKGSSSASKRGISNNSKKPLVSIAKRLPRKMGRIRRNLLGRRANHMARSFITCDTSLRVDELGVPLIIASNLTLPVHVQPYNYEECMMYFMNGNDRYPGCDKIKKNSTGNMHTLAQIRDDFKLEIGDVIYRHLIDGDIVDFNRAPSLESSSISSMKVRIRNEGQTLCMNVTSCSLFNADFDGDAMNLIVPRSSRTINEISELSSPKQRFISYKNACPVIGEAQDSLIGTAELTRTKTKMNKLHAMRMFKNIPVWHDFSQYENTKLWSGREIVSTLFQETGMLINFNNPAKYYDRNWAPYRNYNPQDIQVEIDRGVLKSGILDKNALGEGVVGGIFHIIHNQYGARAAIEASFHIQQLALTYLYNSGVTVSIKDLLITRDALHQIHQIEDGLIAESRMITDKLNQGGIIAPLGKTIEEHYEELQNEALDAGDKLYPPLFGSIDPEYNCFDKLVMYGSKGTLLNFRSIASAVGQLQINGERFKENFGRRCSPYFTRYDSDPRSRGYIPNSYMSGIRVAEFMFHAQETRYQLINKALSTSITGMYNRMAIKNLESHIIDNLRRVNKTGKIIQLLYGGDGVDPRFLERVPIPIAKADLNDVKFAQVFDALPAVTILLKERKETPDAKLIALLKEEFAQLVQDRKFYIATYLGRELTAGKPYQDNLQLPVNLKRIIEDTLYNLELKQKDTSVNDLNPTYVVEKVSKLCNNLVYCLINEIQEKKQSPVPLYMKMATTTLTLMIRSYLNVATLIRMGITNRALDVIIEQIRITYQKSLIAYGTCVGIISAQSISEPLTQMLLDSIHNSGVASTKKKGMERVREILNAKQTEKMKQPSMIIYPKSEWLKNKAKVQEIANTIEMINLSHFMNKWDIFYEAYGKPVYPAYASEAKLIKEFEKFNIHIKPPTDLINWCIRFTVNKSKLIEKQVSMDMIYTALRKVHPYAHIVYTTDNAENIIMRVYLRNTISKKTDVTCDQIKDITRSLLATTIRGIEGINACYIKESNKNFIQPDGSIKSEKIYYIFTDGTNMRKVLMNKWIDARLVQCDSIQETRLHFGIEEARTKINNELGDQIDNKASYRHLEIYSGEMTYNGQVTSIDRYGSAKRETSFMLRISDASPLSVIETSSINAQRDNLEGVSAPIMVGKNPHIGDLYNTFKLDEKFLMETNKNIDNILANL